MIGRDDDGRNTLISVVVAFVPAGIIGKLFGDTVKEHLLNPTPVAITWIVGGVVILAFVANQSKLVTRIESVSDIGVRNAAIIGVAQTLALVPGTSRSFVTILAAMLLGVSLTAAVEFSFLLGFVTLSAATALELVDNGSTMFDTFGVAAPIVGIIVAGVTAFLSVKFMIEWLSSRGLGVFGWYRDRRRSDHARARRRRSHLIGRRSHATDRSCPSTPRHRRRPRRARPGTGPRIPRRPRHDLRHPQAAHGTPRRGAPRVVRPHASRRRVGVGGRGRNDR